MGDLVDDSIVWPAGLMLAGVVVWIVLIVWHAAVSRAREWPPWIEPGLSLAAGGLVVFSGFT